MKPNIEIKDRFHIAEDKKRITTTKNREKKKLEKKQNADDYAINM